MLRIQSGMWYFYSPFDDKFCSKNIVAKMVKSIDPTENIFISSTDNRIKSTRNWCMNEKKSNLIDTQVLARVNDTSIKSDECQSLFFLHAERAHIFFGRQYSYSCFWGRVLMQCVLSLVLVLVLFWIICVSIFSCFCFLFQIKLNQFDFVNLCIKQM